MKDIQPFAQFWCCDLQTHSPLEPEFSPGVDPADTDAIAAAAAKFVQSAVDAGLDAVAITDHNSVSFVGPLTQAAKGKLVIFPGVEISAGDGYHLLAIFEPGTAPSRIQDFLTKVGITKGKERTTQGEPVCADDEWTWGKILEAVDQREDAIAIAPHVRRSKGILKSGVAGEPRARNWRSPSLYAVEDNKKDLKSGSSMTDKIMLNELDDYKRDRLPARIWGSDAKSYDDIGKKRTYIKMVEPSIEGLRQAFLDSGSRIRHPDAYKTASRDRIVNVGWQAGFLADQEVVFSEQLSCLIGGKGTGKSTVVESLRYVFAKEHGLDTALADQFKKLAESALPPGTNVTVEVARKDGSRYSLSRTAPYGTEVRDDTGTVVELEPTDIIDPTILSQGEILDTARQPRSHLALLDSFVEDELSSLGSEESELKQRLARNRSRLTEQVEESEQLAEDKAEIRRLTEAKKSYDKKGVSARTELRRDLDREDRLVKDALEAAEAARLALEELEGLEEPPDLLVDKDLPHKSIWSSLRKKWDKAAKALSDLRERADKAFGDFAADLEGQTAADSEWTKSVAKKREDVSRVYRELQEQYPDLDLAQFDRLDRDLEALESKVADAAGVDEQIKALRGQRAGLLSDLRENRRKQFGIREGLATQLNEDLANTILVEVEFLGDREYVTSRLSNLKTGVRREAIKAVAEHEDFTGELLGRALLDGPDAVAKAFGITKGQAASLVEKTSLEQKLGIEEMAVPERVSIRFNVARKEDKPRFRGLSQLSVGQKATCILLILLAQEDRPLIVDQPEDDLDNRFVYADVVERLRAVKDQRQLILSTHNANIPVLGDAELIAVLDTEEKGGKAVGSIPELGSIDSRAIKIAVTQILEGGPRAFRRRQEKYGPPVPEEAKDEDIS
jgi:hypothetical protein